jgi:hypothetical protein
MDVRHLILCTNYFMVVQLVCFWSSLLHCDGTIVAGFDVEIDTLSDQK